MFGAKPPSIFPHRNTTSKKRPEHMVISYNNGAYFSTSQRNFKNGPSIWWFQRATTGFTFWISQLLKIVRSWGVLTLFTSTWGSRHNGVHFFIICTSKSRPRTRCFIFPNIFRATMANGNLFFKISTSKSYLGRMYFDTFCFKICFVPQRHVTFHLLPSQLSPHPLL